MTDINRMEEMVKAFQQVYYDCKSKREREKQRKLRWKLAVDSLRQVPNCIDIICCKNINVNKSFYQCRTKSMYVLNGVIA